LGEWTRRFDDVRGSDVALVGGKAANLGEMTRAGLPVPPGFCVTAQAYRRFVSDSDTWHLIERHLASAEAADPWSVDGVAEKIRSLFGEREMPPVVASEIAAAYRALNELMRVTRERSAEVSVAVRSSATAEDLPDASFAGQQDTYLNVRGEAALLEHVQRCWASLWTGRAVAYRARQGYDHAQVALAVAVQAMVDANVAGVMFTADPVTGDRDRLVINASWGLGEAIVSGLVTPDTWTIRKTDGLVVLRQIGHKARQVVRTADGGTAEEDVPPDRQDAPSLSAAQLAELAAIGRRIEDHYETPMDVEWAYAAGRCYVLQARPITTLPEAATAPPDGDYNRTMFLEIFPDPLSPAFISVVDPLFASMLHFTFETLGFRPPRKQRAVASLYSQPYFNQRYIEAALAPLRPPTRRVLVDQFVNPFGRHQRGAPFEISVPFLRMALHLLRLMRSLHRLLPLEVERYRAAIGELDSVDLAAESEAELLGRIERLVFRSASRLLNYDFLLIALVGVTYQALGSLLEPYFGEESEELRARLVSGVTGNVTMETNKQIWDLSRLAGSSDLVSAELRRGRDPAELRTGLARSPEGQTFLEALDRFLAEYGHREARMDILYPTWVEDPAPVLSFIRGYLDVSEASSPHRHQERLVRERGELAKRVRQRVRRDLRGRLFVWPIFRWVLRHTQANTRQRDTMHFELTRLFPPFRRLLLELGSRFVARGVIEHGEDIFFLTLDEMKEAAGSPEPRRDLVKLRRTKLEADRRRVPPPIVRDGREEWMAAPEDAGQRQAGELRGIAGSPGRSTGVVRIVRGPEEFDRLRDGDILVAPFTNPVWTPLFAVAGGLVTEVGGILSHGAIVAREYGIPAVMAVSGATSELHDGQVVTVDGGRGLVLTAGARRSAPGEAPAERVGPA
jgi:rifampicin phosphotransferase